MLTFYGYGKCSTCRAALKWLRERGHEPEVVDVTVDPPPAAVLRRLLASGYGVKDLFNRSGEQYRSLGLKDRVGSMGEAEAVSLLSRNGRLVKRPVVTDGARATVGFDASAYAEAWGASGGGGR